MYATSAAGFVLELEVFYGGAVVARSQDIERLKAAKDHLLKPNGFEWIVERDTHSACTAGSRSTG